MDRFPPAEDGPRYEMQSVGRTLDDLRPDEEIAPKRGSRAALRWTGVVLVALMAFVGWLLVGPPIGR